MDIWRSLHPYSLAFTWMKSDNSLSSRIDLIGCPQVQSHSVQSCEIVPCPFSHHSAVVMVSLLPLPFPRGPGRWKLNIAILKDSAFQNSVVKFWAYWRTRKFLFIPSLNGGIMGKRESKVLLFTFVMRSNQNVASRVLYCSLLQPTLSLKLIMVRFPFLTSMSVYWVKLLSWITLPLKELMFVHELDGLRRVRLHLTFFFILRGRLCRIIGFLLCAVWMAL